MSRLNFINIGKNLKILRTATDLSQHDLSTMIQISKRSIAKIENGNKNLSVSKVNILLDFFNLSSSSELAAENFFVDTDLRNKLIARHKIEHPEYLRFLSKTPGIVYAIDTILLPSSFLDRPKQVREIKDYFSSLGWIYKSSSLTLALLRKTEQIKVEKLSGRKDINLYSKKKI